MKVLLRDLDGDTNDDYALVHATTLFDKHLNAIFGKTMKPQDVRSLTMDDKVTLADHMSKGVVYKVIYNVNKKGYVSIKKITLHEAAAAWTPGSKDAADRWLDVSTGRWLLHKFKSPVAT